MRFRHLIQAAVLTFAIAFAGAASADEQSFVRAEQGKITQLLRQDIRDAEAKKRRDQQISDMLSNIVDHDELTRRCFGDRWKDLNDAQKAEIKVELKRLVEKNYKRNLIKTLDYDVTFRGSEPADSDVKVKTSAKSLKNTREPAYLVDYIIANRNGTYKIVDIVTEGSYLTRNYRTQFIEMLDNKAKGWSYLINKVREKANKRD